MQLHSFHSRKCTSGVRQVKQKEHTQREKVNGADDPGQVPRVQSDWIEVLEGELSPQSLSLAHDVHNGTVSTGNVLGNETGLKSGPSKASAAPPTRGISIVHQHQAHGCTDVI
jgi:hypothetical protein